ncbi:hypothetical protein ACFX19_041590 [Malus domestica]
MQKRQIFLPTWTTNDDEIHVKDCQLRKNILPDYRCKFCDILPRASNHGLNSDILPPHLITIPPSSKSSPETPVQGFEASAHRSIETMEN